MEMADNADARKKNTGEYFERNDAFDLYEGEVTMRIWIWATLIIE